MTFVDMEKAFDQVPWKVIWWALRKLGEETWIVQQLLVQGMYASAQICVGVGKVYSQELKRSRCLPMLGTQSTTLHHCA